MDEEIFLEFTFTNVFALQIRGMRIDKKKNNIVRSHSNLVKE